MIAVTHATRWRSFRTAAWLGWQIESNWTEPFLFAVYSIVKPLALAGILVVMYAVITNADFDSPAFAFMYLGNAFYIYVGAVTTGMAYAVIDDRERYRMLKSVYVAPIDFRLYLAGRGVARFLSGSISVLVTLAFGILFLQVRIDPLAVNWGLLVAALFMGIVMLATLGLLLAGMMLLVVHQSWSIGEAVAGSLYLLSGAIFPLDVLPWFLRPFGFAMPLTYWLELLRRALVPEVSKVFPTLSGISDLGLLVILAVLTSTFGTAALVAFGRCEHHARQRGLIDRTTNY
jgi:ABC-2 type transport system permease protein